MGSALPARAAAAEPGAYGVVVVEHLRVKVPADAVDAWLEAEQGSWEPWLARQPGFLDRQLLWDPEREEGTLLIHWRSRDQWKAIPEREIAQVQEHFETLARQATGSRQGNPFPLVFEGELLPR
ncbi:MAG: TIGR03792 family protein [Cyanobacteriota bacterium]